MKFSDRAVSDRLSDSNGIPGHLPRAIPAVDLDSPTDRFEARELSRARTLPLPMCHRVLGLLHRTRSRRNSDPSRQRSPPAECRPTTSAPARARPGDTALAPIYAVEMTKRQLTRVGAIATIGGGIVTLHGVTSGRWQRAHTIFAMVGGVVGVLSFLQSLRRDDVSPVGATAAI